MITLPEGTRHWLLLLGFGVVLCAPIALSIVYIVRTFQYG